MVTENQIAGIRHKIIYMQREIEYLRAHMGGGSGGDASTLQGQSGSYYLTRSNQTGTQPANTITGLSTVATSGAYADLTGKPTIPTLTSQLTNDSGYVVNTRTVAGFPLSSNVTLATLSPTNSTLTFSTNYNGSAASTIGINLANTNTWTASQTFAASTNTQDLIPDGNNTRNIGTSSLRYLSVWATALRSGGTMTVVAGAGSAMVFQSTAEFARFSATNGNLLIGTTTDNSASQKLQVAGSMLTGGFATSYREIIAVTTILVSDYTINITSGTFSQPLPASVKGQIYVIKNSGAGVITLTPPAGTIDAGATATITTGNSLTVQGTGATTGVTYIII